MLLKEFKAAPSQFKDVDGKKVEYGKWRPSYFGFITLGTDQWLVVSLHNWVELPRWLTREHGDVIMNLAPVPDEYDIKGLVNLEWPGTYFLHHKVFKKQ